MPGEIQRIEFGRRSRGGIDPELRQNGLKVFPMQNIQPDEGTAARTDLLHRRRIAAPPRVGKATGSVPGAYRAGKAADSRATPPRQSTTVPKTSKTSA
jgi:hypothetical protein